MVSVIRAVVEARNHEVGEQFDVLMLKSEKAN